MNKDELYYVVQKGTNSRGTTMSNEVLIVDADNVDRVLGTYSDLYEKMTITDFNKKFREDEIK